MQAVSFQEQVRNLVYAALVFSGLAAAQDTARERIEQKEALVRRLLADPQMRERAEAMSEAARRQLQAAASMHARSVEHLKRGEHEQAEAALDDAMRAVGRSRRLAPDSLQRAVEERVRYERLLAGVEALRGAYERHLQGKPDELREALEANLAQARAAFAAGRSPEALRALERAETGLLHGLNRVLGAGTLQYTVQFDSPQSEYRYELERNRSYAALVPVALNELRPAGDGLQLVNRYVETNEALVALAARQAERSEWSAALGSVKTGTSYLQRALGAAGLVVPQAIRDRNDQ